MRGRICAVGAALCCAGALAAAGSAPARARVTGPTAEPKQPVAYGTGGGAASMSRYGTAAAIKNLQQGGNAVDAAVAAATTLGVTEPFVAGAGGGGYFVYSRAKDRKVFTIDGREKAPAGAQPNMFLDAAGNPLPFEQAVESGVSVGGPGPGAPWGVALQRFGPRSLATGLEPAEDVATKGFPLDTPLVNAIRSNQAKLARFPASAKLFLPGGKVPSVGDRLRNPDLARTYRQLGRHGYRWFYTGPIASQLSAATRNVAVSPGSAPAAGGTMTATDLANYRAVLRDPVSWTYRGYRLWGMPPSSSGGTTVGETMNILETFDQSGDRTDALYRYLEALKLAYADRGKYVGDTDFVPVPVRGLLSKGYAHQRAALIGPTAATTPVAAGDPTPFDGAGAAAGYQSSSENHEQHTNHPVVADRRGNVVSYTNTIEQIGGSGITLANRGFLLNNELTDFNFPTGTANSVQANKRPRSSMSPTIVTKGGRVVEAIGSPGGSTIITTVTQTLLNQFDFGMSLPEAIEAPRASQSNSATTMAEPAFTALYGPALQAKGEKFAPPTPTGSLPAYIGIAAGLVFLPHDKLETATESWRGGGGSAMVGRPQNPIP